MPKQAKLTQTAKTHYQLSDADVDQLSDTLANTLEQLAILNKNQLKDQFPERDIILRAIAINNAYTKEKLEFSEDDARKSLTSVSWRMKKEQEFQIQPPTLFSRQRTSSVGQANHHTPDKSPSPSGLST